MKQRILLKVVFLFCSITFFGQDYHFSQFNAMPFWLNPASVAGQGTDVDAGLIYRTQYTGISNPYNTYGAFASAALMKRRDRNSYLGIGLGFIQDDNKNIQYKSTLAALALSYHLRLNRTNVISVGLQPFFFQNSVNYGGLKWGSQYDGTNYNPSLPTGAPANYSQLSKIDGSFGFNYQYAKGNHNSIVERESRFQAGFSMYHLPGVHYSLYDSQEKVYSRFCLNMAYTYKKENSRIGYNPLLMVQLQGPAKEIIFGANVFYILQEASNQTGIVKGSSLGGGLMYRVGDAIIVTGMLNYDSYSFGIAYDINASTLTTSTKTFGAFELSVRYRLNKGHWH
jgi:type IX secretion system PorP/SprF family membrane protein